MKYIDAEKLIERLEEVKRAEYENCGGVNSKTGALQEVQELIASLQQEQPSLPSNLDEAAIQAAQIDMCDRQIMEDSNEHRMLYSRIFRRGFKACAEFMTEQGVSMQITDDTEWEEVDSFIHKNVDGCSIIQIRKK